jgi:hypothetical protein
MKPRCAPRRRAVSSKGVDAAALGARKLVEIGGQVEDFAQGRELGERDASGEQLARAGDGGKAQVRYQQARLGVCDPERVVARDLATVHGAKLAELHVTRRPRRRAMPEGAPARGLLPALARHRASAVERTECFARGHARVPDCPRSCANFEASDRRRGEGVRERARARFHDVQRDSTELLWPPLRLRRAWLSMRVTRHPPR